MNDYIIMTDSGCDLSEKMLKKLNVKSISFSFHFEDDEKEILNTDYPAADFYKQTRMGRMSKTSNINSERYTKAFEEELQKGVDIIYLAFSSGLSCTYNSAIIARDELADKYPDQKLIVVDTLCGSAGQGLMLCMAVEQKNAGATIEEVEKFVLDNRLNICHWVAVDDLKHLKRGGRVSSGVALVGTVLGIKPIVYMNDEGKLINIGKVRGRNQSIEYLADKFNELCDRTKTNRVFISHGDCYDDAKRLKEILEKKYKANVELITDIGAVIGSHSGAGTLSMQFYGKSRI